MSFISVCKVHNYLFVLFIQLIFVLFFFIYFVCYSFIHLSIFYLYTSYNDIGILNFRTTAVFVSMEQTLRTESLLNGLTPVRNKLRS